MTEHILAAKGQKILVDKVDYEFLNQWKWHVSSSGYAVRSMDGGMKKVLMHRFIISVPSYMETDHINRNKLDNRRTNLRACDHSTNMLNRSFTSKGVSWDSKSKKWRVRIQRSGLRRYYGLYKSKKDADKLALQVLRGVI